MTLDEFSKKLIQVIRNKVKDPTLLSHEIRGIRSGYFFGLISFLNQVINFFQFQNTILFTNKKSFIQINGIYLEIVNKYFLKIVNQTYISKADLIIKYLNKVKFEPKIILDIGACWGEYSLILAKHFNKSTIYAVEGSNENFKILINNINFKLNNINNVKAFNYIISDSNDIRYIRNIIGTTNIVKKEVNVNDINYSKIQSISLKNFLKINNLNTIDFIKLDIEGHELNLINDLLELDIKYGQIEIININTFQKNLEFLKLLSKKFFIFDSENFHCIEIKELEEYVSQKLHSSISFDIFFSLKK